MRDTLRSISLLALALVVACGPGQTGKGPKNVDNKNNTTTKVDKNAFSDNGPAPGAELKFPEEAFRAQQPEGGEPHDFKLPPVETFDLGGGVTAYLVERHELPTISVDLNLEGGSINDPRNKAGLASVCMDLLSEGTQKLDKLAFRAALADIASDVGSYAGPETQGVTMRTLTKHFDETFALFRDTLREPGFRKSDLDRMVKRRLEALKQAKKSPPGVSRRLADVILYGDRHPFGKVVTARSYKAINVGDCKRYHASYLKPRGARLYVVGDMTKAQVKAKFAPLLQGWKGRPRRSARLGKPHTRRGKLFFVNIPGAAQSVVRVMHFGPQRTADDFFANNLMSSILGGSFSSRVNMNLREDKGYTYGARATLQYSRHYGEVVASAAVRADSTHQSILEIFSEMRGLASGERPALPTELEREKNGDILGLPGFFSTARASLARYRALVYYGLPLDYYNSYVENVKGVTLEAVNASAKKHLHPDQAVLLIVGDAAAPQIKRVGDKDVPLMGDDGKPMTLRASLEKLVKSGDLGRGELVELDADGKLKK